MVSNYSTPASNALPRTHGAHSKVSMVNDDLSHLINDANHATHAEKSMTTYQAFKTYPKAIMFSIILSTAIVMESYDGSSWFSYFMHIGAVSILTQPLLYYYYLFVHNIVLTLEI
jgi:hypothetical protein